MDEERNNIENEELDLSNLKVYVLDKTPEKDNLVKLLERKLQLKATFPYFLD